MLHHLKQFGKHLWNVAISELGHFYTIIAATVLLLLVVVIIWIFVKWLLRGDKKRFSKKMDRLPTDEMLQDKTFSQKKTVPDDEGPDFHGRAEMRDLQMGSDIQSLSHRVTLVSILIPVLFCAVLIFSYLDMRQRISEVQNMESTNVQAIYTDVLDKVESLSGKSKDIEQSLLGRLEALERSSSSIDEDLKKNRQKIKELFSSKSDKKALEKIAKDRLKGIGYKFSSLQKDMTTFRSTVEESLSNMTSKLEKETADLTAYRKDFQAWKDRSAGVSQAIEALQRKGLQLDLALKLLSEAKVDKKKWDAFRKEEKGWKASWEKEIRSIKNDLLSLEEQLMRLRARHIHGAEDSQLQPGGEIPEKTLPPPGGIIEQDISQ